MKKTAYWCTALFLILLVSSCVAPRSLNLNQLRFGMSRQEVYNMAGNPRRILAANSTPDGVLEVLEFVTNRNESYALEFWNDSLVGFEFLHSGVEYIPPMRPPTMRPAPDRPIFMPPARPNPPVRPIPPNPSLPLPTQPSRPGQQGGSSRAPAGSTQPAQPSRPSGSVNQNDSTQPPTRSSESDRTSTDTLNIKGKGDETK